MMKTKTTLGLVVGNRRFFPSYLCEEGRKELLAVLAEKGFGVVALTPEDTPFGSVETRQDAHKCAELFKRHADEIDGVVVTLPNFGDERAVADTLRLSGLQVPVLVHAFPDDPAKMSVADRRDSFCGKLSVCNNLKQYGISYSLTTRHTVSPTDPSFSADLEWFGAVCRVVRGLRRARIGAIGARPAAFKTVRYSEKLLEAQGISVEVIDLSEIIGRMEKLEDAAEEVQARLRALTEYLPTADVPPTALLKMAKFAAVVDEWMAVNELDASAVQCWTAMQEYVGIVPCAVMSMMSERLLPSACEVDVTGALAMYALGLASGRPAALLDWNNNYGDDPDKCVMFHCSNVPKSCFAQVRMSTQEIIATVMGAENAYGTCVGRFQTGPFTFARLSTDDEAGEITAYVGEGEFTDDLLETFGGVGVAHIADLQGLLQYLCRWGFEHHVAVTQGCFARALHEAFSTYLGWDVYHHGCTC
jgi:L-fucose isomerase-like protein